MQLFLVNSVVVTQQIFNRNQSSFITLIILIRASTCTLGFVNHDVLVVLKIWALLLELHAKFTFPHLMYWWCIRNEEWWILLSVFRYPALISVLTALYGCVVKLRSCLSAKFTAFRGIIIGIFCLRTISGFWIHNGSLRVPPRLLWDPSHPSYYTILWNTFFDSSFELKRMWSRVCVWNPTWRKLFLDESFTSVCCCYRPRQEGFEF